MEKPESESESKLPEIKEYIPESKVKLLTKKQKILFLAVTAVAIVLILLTSLALLGALSLSNKPNPDLQLLPTATTSITPTITSDVTATTSPTPTIVNNQNVTLAGATFALDYDSGVVKPDSQSSRIDFYRSFTESAKLHLKDSSDQIFFQTVFLPSKKVEDLSTIGGVTYENFKANFESNEQKTKDNTIGYLYGYNVTITKTEDLHPGQRSYFETINNPAGKIYGIIDYRHTIYSTLENNQLYSTNAILASTPANRDILFKIIYNFRSAIQTGEEEPQLLAGHDRTLRDLNRLSFISDIGDLMKHSTGDLVASISENTLYVTVNSLPLYHTALGTADVYDFKTAYFVSQPGKCNSSDFTTTKETDKDHLEFCYDPFRLLLGVRTEDIFPGGDNVIKLTYSPG